jgi:hypothetical protein
MSTETPDQQQQQDVALNPQDTIFTNPHRHPDDVVVAQHRLASRCQTCNLKLLSVFVAHSNVIRSSGSILTHDSNTRRTSSDPTEASQQGERGSVRIPTLNESAQSRNITNRLALQVHHVSSSVVECINLLQHVSATAVRIEGMLTKREALQGCVSSSLPPQAAGP